MSRRTRVCSRRSAIARRLKADRPWGMTPSKIPLQDTGAVQLFRQKGLSATVVKVFPSQGFCFVAIEGFRGSRKDGTIFCPLSEVRTGAERIRVGTALSVDIGQEAKGIKAINARIRK